MQHGHKQHRLVWQLWRIMLLCLIGSGALIGASHETRAQSGERCFSETGYCISGPIYIYWQTHGGITVFGYPISNQRIEEVDGWVGLTQWFERDRLEYHDAEGVKTGRLGATLLEKQGRPWTTFERVSFAATGCLYFGITGHSICEPFLSYWREHGQLEQFGYPITEPFVETISGWTGSVQYFERRRLEWHSEMLNRPVIPGLLGSEVARYMPTFPQLASTLDYSPPTPTVAAHTRTQPYIPILMYHYIRRVDRASDPNGYDLSVTPAQFNAQMEWLAHAGYTTLRMDTVAECLRGTRACPPRSIAITFDDGYQDAYTDALPILNQHTFVATFYVVTDFVGKEGYMGWYELYQLHLYGMEIGSHTIGHLNLTTLPSATAYEQIASSRMVIATKLQIPVVSFCYPFGEYNSTIIAHVQQAGYTNATTTQQTNDQSNPYALPRVRVHGRLRIDEFQQLVQSYTPVP